MHVSTKDMHFLYSRAPLKNYVNERKKRFHSNQICLPVFKR